MFPIDIHDCCKILGIATIHNFLNILKENIFTFPSTFILFSLKNKTIKDKTQLNPWHKNVAQATPATPIFNLDTNITSTTILDSEENTRNINGVSVSPKAEYIPVEILYKNTKINRTNERKWF